MTSHDQHGGNVFAAARDSGVSPFRLLDFSASVNPLGPSPRALRRLAHARRAVDRYPDPDCVELRQALAKTHGLGPERFLIGNGSSELIHLLPLALRLRHAMIIGPTFSEYERAVRICGGVITRIQATPADAYRPPLSEAARRLARDRRTDAPDALFLCNPNSPTGSVAEPEELRALVELAQRRNILTVLDETFVEYCQDRSLLPHLAGHARLLILRSFTKFYGLAGLRIGYLAGRHDLVARIKARQPPWTVNACAQAAALAALTDPRHARASRTSVFRERASLTSGLQTLGVRVYPSMANFLMVELPPAHTARALARGLRARGVLVRDLSRVPGLSNRMIRIGLRTPRDHRRLLAELGTVLAHPRP